MPPTLLGAAQQRVVSPTTSPPGQKTPKTPKTPALRRSKSEKPVRSEVRSLPSARSSVELRRGATVLKRAATYISSAESVLQRAGTNVQLQRASSLPTEPSVLRHAATMPMLHDMEAERPWCGGLWKTQQLIGFLGGIACLIAFCVAQPMKTYTNASAMLGITALCACFWVFEVVPLYVTALLPVVLMPLFEITSSEIAAAAYWNANGWIQLVFVGVFFVDIALEQTQLHRRIALWMLLSLPVVSPGLLLFSFMFICWLLSLFCNSIAVALLISPLAITLLNAVEDHVRDNCSLEASLKQAEDRATAEAVAAEWGTAAKGGSNSAGSGVGSPDVLLQDAAANSGDSGLAQKRAKKQPEGKAADVTCQSDLDAEEVHRFSDAVMLGIAYSTTAGGLGTIVGAIPNFLLLGQPIVQSEVTWSSWFCFAFPISVTLFVLAYAVIFFKYIRGIRLPGIPREVLELEWEDLTSEVGSFSRDELAVAVIQVLQIVLLIIEPWAISPLVKTKYGETLINDSTLACAPAALLFFIPSIIRPGQSVLTWQAVHEHFDFGMVLLIGGSFAITQGFSESGLKFALGDVFASITSHHSALGMQFIIILIIAIATQIFSGIGTASTMLPALSASAQQAVENPMILLLPATVGCSFAFMMPTAMPSNVVVLAKSQELARPLRVRDFFFTGLPLTILAWVAGSFLCYGMGNLVFDSLKPLEQEMCAQLTASCLWVNVPGQIRWMHVDYQACMMVDQLNDAVCNLWNGTQLNVSSVVPIYS